MLPWLLRVILVSWCIHHALARPARRTIRLLRTRSTTAPSFVGDLDQAVEGSSLVEDYVSHQGNSLGEIRRIAPRRRYPSFYAGRFPGVYPYGTDCPECLDGVVTLGESRSYSVMKHPRPDNQVEDKMPESETTTFAVAKSTEITTEVATTDSVTTTEIPVMPAIAFNQADAAEPASLLIEDLPIATAVQRSHFSVDEAVHSSVSIENRVTVPYPLPAVSSEATTVSSRSHTTQWTSSSTSQYSQEPNKSPQVLPSSAHSTVENSSPSHTLEFTSPVSYRTSLKTATSGSSVSFYRNLPSVLALSTDTPSTTERLMTETRVEAVSFREQVVIPQRLTEKVENRTVINEEKSYQFTNVHDKSFHHVKVTHLEPSDKRRAFAPTTQSYRQPEKNYGMPEENYEVDEALSVKTNGRAHGVQRGEAAAGAGAPDSNKFGYVVEGRNYKKYRVEERTNDGFIVGEYGVVRHDDGSLRGVRYTADSTINPRLIYDALVKFLSL